MGTSLWLVPLPNSPEAAALREVIVSLSKAHSSPCFPPHITLASLPTCVSLSEIVTCLSPTAPLEVSFETVKTGQTFFQSIFIVIQASQSLSYLHEHVHKTLGVQPKTQEFAHLSLYYGDEGKEQIAHELLADGVVQTLERRGVSVKGVHKFLVAEVWVVDCRGPPEDWIIVEKISLGMQKAASAGS